MKNITDSKSNQESAYKSFDDYLRHFYGTRTKDNTQAALEASFGKRLAKRVLEVEQTEKDQTKHGAAA